MSTDPKRDADAAATEGLTSTDKAAPVSAGLALGSRLADRYLIDKELDRGNIGAVYLARDEKMGRKVVIKVLLEKSFDDDYLRRKFPQEKEALARMNHPGIVVPLDYGELPGGRQFLVMEFVHGSTLAAVMKQNTLSMEERADIVEQLGDAIEAAHSANVIHRDLKPANVMLIQRPNGRWHVKVIDFGIASVRAAGAGDAATAIAGTPAYMAPEQHIGQPVPASDVFALGKITYEMLVGRRPTVPLEPAARASVLCSGVNAVVDTHIDAALEIEPKKRPHAAAFGSSVARALRQPMAAPSAPAASAATAILPREPAASLQTRRAPATRGWLFAIMTVLGLFGAAGWWARHRAPETISSTSASVSASPAPSRELAYHLTVLAVGKKEPFRLPKEMLFRPGDRVRFGFESAQPGYLYMVNERPIATGTADPPLYNILFPTTSTNAGSARVAAGQTLEVPGEGWFRMDQEEGTEKVWVVWSNEPMAELEAAKHVANPNDRGELRNVDERRQLSDVLTASVAGKSTIMPSVSGNETMLRSPGSVLVAVVNLEHR